MSLSDEVGMKKGCMVVIAILVFLGIIGQCGIQEARKAQAVADSTRVAAMPPAERAADSAKAEYRRGLSNAKVGEEGLLRRNFYVCPSSISLARANELFQSDRKAAAIYVGERGCDISTAGRNVLVEEIVSFGVRRIHYRGDPKVWFVETEAVAAMTSSDIDSLRRRQK